MEGLAGIRGKYFCIFVSLYYFCIYFGIYFGIIFVLILLGGGRVMNRYKPGGMKDLMATNGNGSGPFFDTSWRGQLFNFQLSSTELISKDLPF